MYAAADSRQIRLCYDSIATCILLRIGAFIEIAQYCLFFIFKTDEALLVENRSVVSSLKL